MVKIIKYAKKYIVYMLFAAIACVGSSATMVMLMDFLKNLVDGRADNGIWKIILILVIGVFSNYMVVYMTGSIGARVLKDLREACVNSLLKTSPAYLNRQNRGDIMERVSSDVEGLADFIKGYFKDCLYVPVMAIVFSAYLISINSMLAFFCLLPLVILVPINVKYMKPIKLRQFEYSRELGLTNNKVWEAFDGAGTIKAFNLQTRMEEKYYDVMRKLLKISDETDLKQYNLEPISRAIQELPLAIAIILGGFLVFDNKITIGILIAYISVLRSFVKPLAMSYQLVVRSQTAIVSIKRVFEVIDTPSERKGLVDELPDNGDVLEFENVSFGYNEELILNNISFQVKKGQHVAFIGKSGSGKSTILKLIATFLDVNEGTIKLSGEKYDRLSPEYIRQKIAYVSQDTILFPLSVMDNVRIGNPKASDEQIVNAMEKAGCMSFADTVLAERGSNLSGGQRQRLAMTRAIVKDAQIYLFDEPTSALDRETEAIICKTIEEFSKDKTVITVAHNLSTISNYDCVYMVENGNITRHAL